MRGNRARSTGRTAAPWRNFYRAFSRTVLSKRLLRTDDPFLTLTEHPDPADSGRCWSVAVNNRPSPVRPEFRMHPDWRLESGLQEIAPFSGTLLLLTRKNNPNKENSFMLKNWENLFLCPDSVSCRDSSGGRTVSERDSGQPLEIDAVRPLDRDGRRLTELEVHIAPDAPIRNETYGANLGIDLAPYKGKTIVISV